MSWLLEERSPLRRGIHGQNTNLNWELFYCFSLLPEVGLERVVVLLREFFLMCSARVANSLSRGESKIDPPDFSTPKEGHATSGSLSQLRRLSSSMTQDPPIFLPGKQPFRHCSLRMRGVVRRIRAASERVRTRGWTGLSGISINILLTK